MTTLRDEVLNDYLFYHAKISTLYKDENATQAGVATCLIEQRNRRSASPAPSLEREKPLPPNAQVLPCATDPAPVSEQKQPPVEESMKDFKGEEIPAFDKNKPGWNYCPTCKSVDINHVGKSGKKYQACHDCHHFLNIDKGGPKIVPMKEG